MSPTAAIPFRNRLLTTLAIAVGAIVTLSVYGYHFGQGNHAAYLLDALHIAHPTLLQNDWFTTGTLQYHVLFTRFAVALMSLGILQPGFFVVYLVLIISFHIAWRGIVRHFGGGDGAYLISVALYHLSAAGTALGMYQFFQDSSVLPSNIAGVAMLWALWMLMDQRLIASGLFFGLAGAFHLNFGIIGTGLWIILSLFHIRDLGGFNRKVLSHSRWRGLLIGTLAALTPSAINIAYAARSKLTRSDGMPLNEFVDIYVHLRHSHHYDPASWPALIWAALIWTIIPAVVVLRGAAIRIYYLLMFLIIVALLGAGITYVSETLIQMSLYRFSIYLQLFGCATAGVLVERSLSVRHHHSFQAIQDFSIVVAARVPYVPYVTGLLFSVVIAAACLFRGPFFGLFHMPQDEADYVQLCQWVSANTPSDAIFVVPPDEESMRLIGQRAIVVNYKCVPQLSAELAEWRNRLCDVLDIRDITNLPHGYTQVFPAIRKQYDRVADESLEATARKYRARYIVTTHPAPQLHARQINVGSTGRYILYDLGG